MCMSLDLGKCGMTCIGGIAGFGRMGACPSDQQSSRALGLQEGTGKLLLSLTGGTRPMQRGNREGEDSWVAGTDHGKETAACTL